MICALPRVLDADVFQAAVGCPESEATQLYGWLNGLTFVQLRGGRVQYHGVVRSQMLRWLRQQSPRAWRERQERLAETIGAWRREAEAGLVKAELWGDEGWRELRLSESYHLLCSGRRGVLPDVLRDVVDALDEDEAVGRRWAQMLLEAGEDADAVALGTWGHELLSALENEGTIGALGLLIDRAGFDGPAQAWARAVRGRDLRESGELERAVADYDRALDLDPELDCAYYGRGRTRRKQDQYEEALVDLDCAVRLVPTDAEYLEERAFVYWCMDRHPEAVSDADRTIELDATYILAHVIRGDCCKSLGREAEALESLGAALRLNPDSASALVIRASVWAQVGDCTRQMEDLNRSVEVNPDFRTGAFERGEALRLAGRHEEALADFDRAIRLDDSYAKAYASRGVAYSSLGRDDEALEDLNRAVALDGDYVWALVQRSFLRRERGEHVAQMADLDLSVEAAPDSGWVAYWRAEALRQARRYEAAVADYDRAIREDDNDELAYAGRGVAHALLDQGDQALADLSKALHIDESWAWARGERARVLRWLGRFEDAMADLDQAVELGLNEAWSVRERFRVNLAMGRLEQVGADVLRYLELTEEQTAGQCMLAAFHRIQGRPEQALAVLGEIRMNGELDNDLFHELAIVNLVLKNWTAARASSERLRAEDDDIHRVFVQALSVAGQYGCAAAHALWREVDRLSTDSNLGASDIAFFRVISSAGLADWSAVDVWLTSAMSSAPGWDDLADLADVLTILVDSHGADRSRFAPRLAAVIVARNAIQARYAV